MKRGLAVLVCLLAVLASVGVAQQVKDPPALVISASPPVWPLMVPASQYINWGTTPSEPGYGLRANAGTMEYKNNAGSWQPIATAAGSAGGWTDGGTVVQLSTGTDTAYVQSGIVSFGALPSLTGNLRLPTAGTIIARNNANTGDRLIVGIDSGDNLTVGNATSTYVYYHANYMHRFYINNVESARVNNNLQWVVTDGTAGTPAFAFISDPNTGIYSAGTDVLGFSAAGAVTAQVGSLGTFSHGAVLLSTARGALRGGFTSSGASTTAYGLYQDGTITGASGDTDFLAGQFWNNAVTTQAAADTIAIVAQASFAEPQITLGGGSSVTNSTTIYVAGAATEATNNYALWVDAGDVRFDGSSLGVGLSPSAFHGVRIGQTVTSPSAADAIYGFYLHSTLNAYVAESAYVFFQQGTIVEAASGVHAMLAGMHLNPPTITGGAATVTNAATLYINGPTVATVSGGNYALYVASGTSRFDGALQVTGANTLTVGGHAATGGNPSAYSHLRIQGTIAPPDAGEWGYGIWSSPTITAFAGSQNHANFFGGTIAEAGSGVHSLLSGSYFATPTITGGVATATNAATVFIAGPTTATVTGKNHALLVNDASAGAVRFISMTTYADNAAATGAGLVAGQLYRTSTGVVMVVY